MRSIGKRNIKKLEAIVKNVRAEYPNTPYNTLTDLIMEKVPEAWYDIWESAWAEIQRLVSDRLYRGY